MFPDAKRLVEMELDRKYPRHYSVVMHCKESDDETEGSLGS